LNLGAELRHQDSKRREAGLFRTPACGAEATEIHVNPEHPEAVPLAVGEAQLLLTHRTDVAQRAAANAHQVLVGRLRIRVVAFRALPGGHQQHLAHRHARKHNPFVYFTDTASSCTIHDVPYPGSSSMLSALDGSGAPSFVWITPNLQKAFGLGYLGAASNPANGDPFSSF
jgi:hypothetical protein